MKEATFEGSLMCDEGSHKGLDCYVIDKQAYRNALKKLIFNVIRLFFVNILSDAKDIYKQYNLRGCISTAAKLIHQNHILCLQLTPTGKGLANGSPMECVMEIKSCC